MQHVVVVRERSKRIRRAVPLAGRLVRVTWTDSIVDTKDVLPILAAQRSLVRLRSDDALFATLGVSVEGDRIIWDDGYSISAAAFARLPKTNMEAEELRAIMAELHLSSEGLAASLGLSRRAITDYRGGADIPKSVVLAVRYLQELERT